MTTATIALSFILMGCGSINQYRQLDQESRSDLTTSIGGTIFRLNKSSNLPNVIGKADILGGKVDRGYAELRLSSIKDGVLTLEVTEFNKSSAETTMDRYKPLQGNALQQVNVEQNININESNQPNSYKFEFDPKKQKEIVISGIKVTFLDVQPYSIRYVLEDIQNKK